MESIITINLRYSGRSGNWTGRAAIAARTCSSFHGSGTTGRASAIRRLCSWPAPSNPRLSTHCRGREHEYPDDRVGHRFRRSKIQATGCLELRRLRASSARRCKSSARACAKPSTCAAISACWMLPPATATPRLPPHAASPWWCRPTMSAPCSSARESGLRPSGSKSPFRRPTPKICRSPTGASTWCFPHSA